MTELRWGDTGLVHLKPVKVTIRRAMCNCGLNWCCSVCGRDIPNGQLHGVSKDSRHFCLKTCVEPAE